MIKGKLHPETHHMYLDGDTWDVFRDAGVDLLVGSSFPVSLWEVGDVTDSSFKKKKNKFFPHSPFCSIILKRFKVPECNAAVVSF